MIARDILLEQLRRDVQAASEVLLFSPDAPIVHCPGWSVADLVRHHGDVLRWATRIVETGGPVTEEFSAPQQVSELAGWYRDGCTALVDALDRTDPERACWTFGHPPGQTWFWTRRQALEAAIHRWDAQTAVGVADEVPAAVAAEGLTEVVDDLFARQVALGRTAPLAGPVTLTATDLDRQWTLPGPSDLAADRVDLAGPVGTLLLLLWRRVALGDPALSYAGPAARQAELVATRFAP